MTTKDEVKRLAKTLNTKARKTATVGNQAIVPHVFKETGDLVNADNFDATVDLSKLNLNDLHFLDAWREAKWDMQKACDKLGIDLEKGKRHFSKVKYFEFEDAKVKALAKVPTPEWVAAQNLENVYTNKLEDGQRDSLKELAKITGAYKPTTNIQVNANVLSMPQLSPEAAKKAREFFDTIAIEGTHAA